MNYSINYAFDCLNAHVHGKPWLSRSSCSVLHTCRVLPNSLIMRNSMMLSSPNFKPAPARSIVISPPKDSPYLTRTLNDTAALQIYLYHILFSCKINLNLNVSNLNYQLWGNIWTYLSSTWAASLCLAPFAVKMIFSRLQHLWSYTTLQQQCAQIYVMTPSYFHTGKSP